MIGIDKTRLYAGNFPAGSSKGGHPICNSAAPSAHWPRRRGRAVSRWCACPGPEAYPIAARVFQPIHRQKSVLAAKGYTALFGHYLLDGREMDETVALFYRAPHSYTGEDVIELSVHGGSAMADGLQQALIAAGAVPAGPGEFTRRALENGRMSLTQAEAVMEVIAANGRQGAALAKSALDGRLAKDASPPSRKPCKVSTPIWRPGWTTPRRTCPNCPTRPSPARCAARKPSWTT